jgi:hypothetical protein
MGKRGNFCDLQPSELATSGKWRDTVTAIYRKLQVIEVVPKSLVTICLKNVHTYS